MIGAKTDVLGFIPFQNSQADEPNNRFLNDPLLLKPLLGARQSNNKRERLISQRNCVFAMSTTRQSTLTTVRRENEKMVVPGGIADIPNAGLWGRIFG
jgi:hypothetical protein